MKSIKLHHGKVLFALGVLIFCGSSYAADHRDGPIFVNSANSALDINDLYVFPSPSDSKRTVLILTSNPFAGVLSATTFNPLVNYEFKIDSNDNAIEDITLRLNFTAPDANNAQRVSLRRINTPVRGGNAAGRQACEQSDLIDSAKGALLGAGSTGENIALKGGGVLRAGIFDDPFFFDAAGFNRLIGQSPQISGPNTGVISPGDPESFSNPGNNFFGPAVNTMAIVIELPNKQLTRGGKPAIGVWGRLTNTSDGGQVDRNGFPALNTAIVPPIPRNDTASRGDRRNAYNVAHPKNDLKDFRSDFIFVLTNPAGLYKRSTADAADLVKLLLPDILPFDSSKAAGFPNGRKLTDDVIDVELQLLTGSATLSDNTASDSDFLSTFPYLAPANSPGCEFGSDC